VPFVKTFVPFVVSFWLWLRYAVLLSKILVFLPRFSCSFSEAQQVPRTKPVPPARAVGLTVDDPSSDHPISRSPDLDDLVVAPLRQACFTENCLHLLLPGFMGAVNGAAQEIGAHLAQLWDLAGGDGVAMIFGVHVQIIVR